MAFYNNVTAHVTMSGKLLVGNFQPTNEQIMKMTTLCFVTRCYNRAVVG